MTIEFKCECGEIFQVGDEFAGRKGRCPSCKTIMLVPDKEPEPEPEAEPLELHEEVSEGQVTDELQALQGWDEPEGQARLDDVEKTIEDSSPRSASAGLLDRLPRPLLFGIPALLIVLVGLFFLLKPSGDGVQRQAASKGTKEKAPTREDASARATAAKPTESVPTAPQEKPSAPVTAAPEPPKADLTPSAVPSPASPRLEEKSPAIQAPPATPSPVPAPSGEKRASAPSPPSKGTEAKASKSPEKTTTKAQPQTSASAKSPSAAGSYTVNVAAFRSQGMADAYAEVLRKRGLDSFVWATDVAKQGKMYRVSIGRHATRKQADAAAKELQQKENLKTYVVKMSQGQG